MIAMGFLCVELCEFWIHRTVHLVSHYTGRSSPRFKLMWGYSQQYKTDLLVKPQENFYFTLSNIKLIFTRLAEGRFNRNKLLGIVCDSTCLVLVTLCTQHSFYRPRWRVSNTTEVWSITDLLSDGVVAGEVSRVDPREVRTLQAAVPAVAVGEDPGAERATDQVTQVVLGRLRRHQARVLEVLVLVVWNKGKEMRKLEWNTIKKVNVRKKVKLELRRR